MLSVLLRNHCVVTCNVVTPHNTSPHLYSIDCTSAHLQGDAVPLESLVEVFWVVWQRCGARHWLQMHLGQFGFCIAV